MSDLTLDPEAVAERVKAREAGGLPSVLGVPAAEMLANAPRLSEGDLKAAYAAEREADAASADVNRQFAAEVHEDVAEAQTIRDAEHRAAVLMSESTSWKLAMLEQLRDELQLVEGRSRSEVLIALKAVNDDFPKPVSGTDVGRIVSGERPSEDAMHSDDGGSDDGRAERHHARFDRLDLAYMASHEPPPVDWIIDRFAARDEVTLLHGAAGIGKSMLMQSAAVAVTEGKSVAGWPTKKGRAIYLDAENGRNEVHRRAHAMGAAEGLAYYLAEGAHIERDRDEIARLVRTERADLLVIDSLRRLTPGADENSSDEMLPAIAALSWIARHEHVAVVVIHHDRKDGITYRGSSVTEDQVQIRWHLTREVRDIENRCKLSNDKMRVAEMQPDRWIEIEPNGAHLADAPDPDDIGGPELMSPVLDALQAADVPLNLSDVARAIGRDRTDGSVRRALDKLLQSERIEKVGGKYAPLDVPVPVPGISSGGTPECAADVPPAHKAAHSPTRKGATRQIPGTGTGTSARKRGQS